MRAGLRECTKKQRESRDSERKREREHREKVHTLRDSGREGDREKYGLNTIELSLILISQAFSVRQLNVWAKIINHLTSLVRWNKYPLEE